MHNILTSPLDTGGPAIGKRDDSDDDWSSRFLPYLVLAVAGPLTEGLFAIGIRLMERHDKRLERQEKLFYDRLNRKLNDVFEKHEVSEEDGSGDSD